MSKLPNPRPRSHHSSSGSIIDDVAKQEALLGAGSACLALSWVIESGLSGGMASRIGRIGRLGGCLLSECTVRSAVFCVNIDRPQPKDFVRIHAFHNKECMAGGIGRRKAVELRSGLWRLEVEFDSVVSDCAAVRAGPLP